MSYEECYRVCGDRSGLVLRKYGFRYSSTLLSKRHAIERTVRLDVMFAFKVTRPSYGRSRYSDGTWPVLYTATNHETSLHEIGFHARREWLAGLPAHVTPPKFKRSTRLLYAVEVDTITQRTESMTDPRLLDSTDYTYCHAVARDAQSNGFRSIRVPSVRKRSGICIPVFERSAIRTKASISIQCSVRWYPATDRLVHTANDPRKPEAIALWRT